MIISAHGATLDITAGQVSIARSVLAQSLGAPAKETIATADIEQVRCDEPTAASFGRLVICAGSREYVVRFAPGTGAQPAAAQVRAALDGNLTDSGGRVAGLDFAAVHAAAPGSDWANITEMSAVRFRDGQEEASQTWELAGPSSFADIAAELRDFLGADVIVAYNAVFHTWAMWSAARAAGADSPAAPVACALALAREASRAGLIEVADHRLGTLAQQLGLPEAADATAALNAAGTPGTADDAAAGTLTAARAAGALVAALARLHGFTGGVDELFAQCGFVLGAISAAEVMPILRAATAPRGTQDRGAGTDFRDSRPGAAGPATASATGTDGTAAASGREATANPGANAGASADPSTNEVKAAGAAGRSRGPAPWAAVATPNTIPEPNPDADPAGALYGQHVTLTGDFEPFDKGTLWAGIAERGGQVGKSVTKKTTIVVLGTWATTTSKEKRADELIAKGQDIAKWPQERLLTELGLNEQPPF